MRTLGPVGALLIAATFVMTRSASAQPGPWRMPGVPSSTRIETIVPESVEVGKHPIAITKKNRLKMRADSLKQMAERWRAESLAAAQWPERGHRFDRLPRALPPNMAIAIREFEQLWAASADSLWPGFGDSLPPIVAIIGERDYLCGAREPFGDFIGERRPFDADTSWRPDFHRRRLFDPGFVGTFSVSGRTAIFIGTPDQCGLTLTEFVLALMREAFNAYLDRAGGRVKLQVPIAGDRSPGWELRYAFPYDDASYGALISTLAKQLRVTAYTFYTVRPGSNELNALLGLLDGMSHASVDSTDSAGTAQFNERLHYMRYELWKSGSTQYVLQRACTFASKGERYRMDPSFAALVGAETYSLYYSQHYASQALGFDRYVLAQHERRAWGDLGAAMCATLDRLDAKWRAEFFAPESWLDEQIIRKGTPPKQE